MANQIDITPATSPSLGLHVHAPAGNSASIYNHATDFPNVTPASALNSKGKAASLTVAGVRFSNPS